MRHVLVNRLVLAISVLLAFACLVFAAVQA
jgi:hypothetical protein